ncbi:MAG: FAD-dependent oxidoreductase [Tahibacter sp.]
MREVHTSLLIVGAGPAGIVAAVTAAEFGIDVCLIDMQARPGGQIWRGQWEQSRDSRARHWMQALRASGVRCEFGARLIDAPEIGIALATTADGGLLIHYDYVLIATGARERLLPFPGWTLPGVCGAGGLQVLVKDGLPIRNKRVVVAGSGPLLLAVAATLRERGAQVLAMVEQAGWRARWTALPTLLRSPRLLHQAIGYAWTLRGIPMPCNAWPVRASGVDKVQSAIISIAGKEQQFDCDYLAAGFGLIPNLDVAACFGCRIEQGAVSVDQSFVTSVPGIYCAGEGTGIGGVDQAIAQGLIAAFEIAQREPGRAVRRRARLARNRAQSLLRHTVPRAELRDSINPETLICRCENVCAGALRDCSSAREARLHTRFGMGHCQGRICAPIAEFLHGWACPLPRAPLAPTPVSHLDLSTLSTLQRGTSP